MRSAEYFPLSLLTACSCCSASLIMSASTVSRAASTLSRDSLSCLDASLWRVKK